jgi:putative ABC transport system permease protein
MRKFFNQPQLSYIRFRLPEKDVEASASLIPTTAEKIRQLLHERHHITPPETDDFSIVTASDVAAAARGISGTLTALLMVLAGLGLLVGGLVMMNILLVAVTERTKEIGLRRAVGATQGAIFTQFLAESLAVTTLGAILGVAIGWVASFILKNYTSLKVETSWEPFVLAAAFALVVGLVFGVLPARRAARLNPVDALR